MKPIDFHEKKAVFEGKVTPRTVIENLMQAIDEGMVESIVFVAKQPDGQVVTGWSNESCLHHLGLLKCGEAQVLKEMYE